MNAIGIDHGRTVTVISLCEGAVGTGRIFSVGDGRRWLIPNAVASDDRWASTAFDVAPHSRQCGNEVALWHDEAAAHFWQCVVRRLTAYLGRTAPTPANGYRTVIALTGTDFRDADRTIAPLIRNAGLKDTVCISAADALRRLNRHTFVTGMTGYGKTNTCMQILLGAYCKLGVPFLVLEPAKAEYSRLARVPELRGRLRVCTIGPHSPLPFRLNPLAPVPGVPLGRHIDLLKAVFNASFPMFAGMPYVLEEAILDLFRERGWSLYTSANDHLNNTSNPDDRAALLPCLQDLHDQVEVVLGRKRYGAALRSRLRSLMVGNKGMVLNARRSTPLEDLFDGPTVIQLQDLGDDEEKAFVMALLFVLLYEFAEVRQRGVPVEERGRLKHLTLIEKAHRLLQAPRGPSSPEVGNPQAKAVTMFTDMLAEMRAYGEGFVIADQIPTKLAPETMKNTNLKIVHRLSAPDDRRLAGECMNLTDWQIRDLNSLRPGLAVVHDERIGDAVLVAVNPAKESRAAELPEAELRALLRVADAGSKAYLIRHAGCRGCPAPCQFLHRLEEFPAIRDVNLAARPFLEAILFGEAPHFWAAWSRWYDVVRISGLFSAGATPETAQGVVYCAAAQAAYDWLGQLLVDRDRTADKPATLSPTARLQREIAVRAISDLLSALMTMSPFNTAFEETQRRVRAAVSSKPPRELSGCERCPARCQLLPYVTPLDLTKLAGQLTSTLAAPGAAADRLAALGQKLKVIEQSVSPLVRSGDDSTLRRQWLYCLLTNLEVPPAAHGGRDELLGILARQPSTDAASGFA